MFSFGNTKLPTGDQACLATHTTTMNAHENHERMLNNGGYHDKIDGHDTPCQTMANNRSESCAKREATSTRQLMPTSTSASGCNEAVAAKQLFEGIHRALAQRTSSLYPGAALKTNGGTIKRIGGKARRIGGIEGRSSRAVVLDGRMVLDAPAASSTGAAAKFAVARAGDAESAPAPPLSRCLSAATMMVDDDATVVDYVVGHGGLARKNVLYCVSKQGHDMWQHVRRLPKSCWRSVRQYNKAHGLAKSRS